MTPIGSKTFVFLGLSLTILLVLSSTAQGAIQEETVDLGPEDSEDINLRSYGTPGEELEVHIELIDDDATQKFDISIHLRNSDENLFDLDNTSKVEFRWEYPQGGTSYYLTVENNGDEELSVLVRFGTPGEFQREGEEDDTQEVDAASLVICGIIIIVSILTMFFFFYMAQKRRRSATIQIPTLTGELKTVEEGPKRPSAQRSPPRMYDPPVEIVEEAEYVPDRDPIYHPIPSAHPYKYQPPPYYPFYPPPPPPPQMGQRPPYICPDCERSMVYNAHIQRWFCYYCNAYKNP